MGQKRWNTRLKAIGGEGVFSTVDGDVLAEFLAERRSAILRSPHYSGSPDKNAHGKRRYRELRSAFLKKLMRQTGEKRRVTRRIGALLYRPGKNSLRDTVCPDFSTDWVPMRRRLRYKSSKELTLSNFSFARDPVGTLRQLRNLVKSTAIYPDLRLNFADQDCDDVTPYIVMAHLTRSLPPIIGGGKITREVGQVITAVGMRQDLRIGTISRKNRSASAFGADSYSVSAFQMATRTAPKDTTDDDRQLRPQWKERVADDFVNTLNGWLQGHQLELTEPAMGSLVGAVGEALDNAERHGAAHHGKADGDWSIAGFSRLIKKSGLSLLRCSVGIVSVGATISDSLSSAAPVVKARIDSYVERHTPLFRARHSIEGLRTVMALQDGITRVESATEERRGGVGFMELVEVFAELGENDQTDMASVFTILSGRSCIRVTAPYRQGERKEGGLRELWFNDSNSDTIAPSQEHVMTLDDAFPGVILSACFTIDPEYLRQKLEQ